MGLGLTLLAVAAAASFVLFGPEAHHEVRGNEGLVVDAITSREIYRYPAAIPVRVVLRNDGSRPLTVTWPGTRRLEPGCASPPAAAIPVQRDAVELWFHGDTIGDDGSRTPFLWHRSEPAPARLMIPPRDERVVAKARFVPPAGVTRIEGTLCVRAYGFTLATGSYETARR